MQPASRSSVKELESVIGKMSLGVCCVEALPEFGVKWRDVSQAVRNARLPMTMPNVARVLCKHVARSLTQEELVDIVARLRLKLVATQSRVWHVVSLTDLEQEQRVATLIKVLPRRLSSVLESMGKGNVVVQTVNLGNLVYMSLQLVTPNKCGSPLFVATPPGRPLLLVSSVNSKLLLKACAIALGYKGIEDANLYGRDIPSLLQIFDRHANDNVALLNGLPEYNPVPIITRNGIDFTNKAYDDEYVENLLGPNPPLLTDLHIQTTKPFYDVEKWNKNINLTINLKSNDIAKTLKAWVSKKALAPTSEFFMIFNQLKSNKFNYEDEL